MRVASVVLVLVLAMAAPVAHAQLMMQEIDLPFDKSVAVDEASMIVGAVATSWTPYGEVALFESSRGRWEETYRIQETGSTLGESVALSGQRAFAGDTWHTGTCSHNGERCTVGIVRTFERIEGQWRRSADVSLPQSVGGFVRQARFGASVASNGDWLLVSAPGWREHEASPSRGVALFFRRQGSDWVYTFRAARYDDRIAMDGNLATVGRQVYRLVGGTWIEDGQLPLWPTHTGSSPSVSVDGGRIALGKRSTGWPHATADAGAAYIFERGTGGWMLRDSVSGVVRLASTFGMNVLLKGNRLIVEEGTQGFDAPFSMTGGLLHVYEEQGGVWRKTIDLLPVGAANHLSVCGIRDSEVIAKTHLGLQVYDPTVDSSRPALVEPQTGFHFGGQQDTIIVSFRWEAVAGAAGYLLAFGTADYFGTDVIAATDTATTVTLVRPLDVSLESRVSWKVSAVFGAGTGPPSESHFFVSLTAPPPPPPPPLPYDPAIFAPLSEGNYWEYEVTRRRTGSADVINYEVYRLGGDSTIDGETYQTLYAQRTDRQHRELARWMCFVRRTPAGTVDYGPPDHQCSSAVPLQAFDPYDLQVEQNDVVTIGDRSYEVEWAGWAVFAGYGPGGAGGGSDRRFASDVGAYFDHGWTTGHIGVGGGTSSTTHVLTFAEIDGLAYGTRLVEQVLSANWAALSPFAPGSRWTYYVHNQNPPNPAPGPYLAFQAGADTLIEGISYRLLSGEELDYDLGPITRWSWAVRIGERGLISELLPLGASPATRAIPALSFSHNSDPDFPLSFEIAAYDTQATVGDDLVEVNAIAEYRAALTVEDDREHLERTHAEGVGVVRHRSSRFLPETGWSQWEARLVYAEIDGERYGHEPEPQAPPDGFATLSIVSAYPNPFTNRLYVELANARGAEVTVELVDMLGRQVWTRRLLVADRYILIDLAPGAAGMYLLRATDGQRGSASWPVIRLKDGEGS